MKAWQANVVLVILGLYFLGGVGICAWKLAGGLPALSWGWALAPVWLPWLAINVALICAAWCADQRGRRED